MSHSLPEPIFQLHLRAAEPVGMIAASESFQAGSDRWNFVVFETRYSFLFWIPPINMRMLHYCWLFPKLLDILQHYRFSHINVVTLLNSHQFLAIMWACDPCIQHFGPEVNLPANLTQILHNLSIINDYLYLRCITMYVSDTIVKSWKG